MSTLRYAWRSIAKHPLYLTLSTVTLGLGIGVCVSNFATVDALVLRPLLLPDVDRLVIIGRESTGGPDLGDISPADYFAFSDQLTSIERFSGGVAIEGRPEPSNPSRQRAQRSAVSEGYFQTMGIGLIRRRLFTSADRQEVARVAVVNEALVRRYFPDGANPIGQRIRIGLGRAALKNPWLEIVGVSADVRHLPADALVLPLIYRPLDQAGPPRFFTIALLSATADPFSLSAPVRRIVRSLDNRQPVSEAQSLSTVISNQFTGFWYVATIMGIVGALALLLCAVGMYSVMAFFVTERTHEIGIRMAMGAARGNVIGQVIGQGLKLAAVGLTIGLIGAMFIARGLASMLFGVGATDFVQERFSCSSRPRCWPVGSLHGALPRSTRWWRCVIGK